MISSCVIYKIEEPKIWPPNLVVLKFDLYQNEINEINEINAINGIITGCKNLKHLTLSKFYNEPTQHLSSTLVKLKFGNYFNQIPDNLSNNLKYIKFGYTFNKYIDHLPNYIETIKFGYKFNQIITRLPTNLRKLEFGYMYNQSLNKDNLLCEKHKIPSIDTIFNSREYILTKKPLNSMIEMKKIVKCRHNNDYDNIFDHTNISKTDIITYIEHHNDILLREMPVLPPNLTKL